MQTLLSVSGLTRRFKAVTALDNVNLDVRQGEIIGLIGPNGAGKTSLMSCIAGLEFPQQGTIRFFHGSSARETLFYLPDDLQLYPELRAGQTLDLFAAAFGKTRSMVSRVRDALGLAAVYHQRAGSLSKGYRRRLLLGVSMLAPQPLLMLDEPFDGLDLRQIRSVVALLRDLPGQGRTLLLSIHQLNDAERVCDRFALLADGRLLATGSLPELRKQAGMDSGSLEEVFLELT